MNETKVLLDKKTGVYNIDRTNHFEWTQQQMEDQIKQFEGNLETLQTRLTKAQEDKAKLVRVRDNKATLKDLFEILSGKNLMVEIDSIDKGITQLKKGIPEFEAEIKLLKPHLAESK